MGAAARALIALCAVAALPGIAAADDSCWVAHRHGPYPVCFDPGNRLHLDVATGGVGGGVELRHSTPGDDPDVTWRLEHRIASVRASRDVVRGTVYAGRYLRHASDGHVVLPFGRPRKLFLPFDVGAEAELGTLYRNTSTGSLRVGAVRTAALIDLSRSDSFRRRLSIGAAARWDIEVDEDDFEPREHEVAPFSLAAIDARVESKNGLTLAGVRAEAGGIWSTVGGWQRRIAAEAEIERVVLAVQDRPLSIFVGGGYEPSDRSWAGLIGVRLSPLVRIPNAQSR